MKSYIKKWALGLAVLLTVAGPSCSNNPNDEKKDKKNEVPPLPLRDDDEVGVETTGGRTPDFDMPAPPRGDSAADQINEINEELESVEDSGGGGESAEGEGEGQGQGQGQGEGEGEGQGSGSGSGEGQGEGQGEGEGEGEGQAPPPTPSELENKWNFYHYCVVSENALTADKYAKNFIESGIFPDRETFDRWLAAINHTVQAMRYRMKVPQNIAPTVEQSCSIAYDKLKSLKLLDLGEQDNEKLGIQLVEPVSGDLQLRSLNLRHNDIRDILFLRNLTTLTHLDVSYNQILTVGSSWGTTKRFHLPNLEVFSIEHQGQMGSQMNLYLTSIETMTELNIYGNYVTPTPFAKMREDLKVNAPEFLWFIAGVLPYLCNTVYKPIVIEEARKKACQN